MGHVLGSEDARVLRVAQVVQSCGARVSDRGACRQEIESRGEASAQWQEEISSQGQPASQPASLLAGPAPLPPPPPAGARPGAPPPAPHDAGGLAALTLSCSTWIMYTLAG